METSSGGEKLSLILATIVLIIGMMYMSVQAAEDSRQRAAAGRGEGRSAQATPAPVTSDQDELSDEDLLGLLNSSPSTSGGPSAPRPGGGVVPGPGAAPDPGGGFQPGPRATPSPANDDPSVNPPGQISQPRPGTYTYSRGNQDGDSYDLQMEPAGANRFRERVQQGSEDFSFTFETEMVWGSDTKVMDKVTFTFGGMSSTCDWQPDITIYRMPLSRGASWQSTGNCQSPDPTDPTKTYDVTYEATSVVVGAQRLSIGGRDVEAWIVETNSKTTSSSGEDSNESDGFTRDWVSPAHGISIRMFSQGGFTSGYGEYTVTSVDPR